MSEPSTPSTTGSLRAVAAAERDDRKVLVIARDYAQAADWARAAGISGRRFLWLRDVAHLDGWTRRTATIRALDYPTQGWTGQHAEALAERIAAGFTVEGAPEVIAALTRTR